jgi:hypothetical protein
MNLIMKLIIKFIMKLIIKPIIKPVIKPVPVFLAARRVMVFQPTFLPGNLIWLLHTWCKIVRFI